MALIVLNNKDLLGFVALKYAAGIFFIVASIYVERKIAQKVKEPFIDEIFHLNQCQKYCAFKFKEWDNKITTPPGLYIIGFVYTRVINLLTGDDFEDSCQRYEVLRSINVVGGLVILPIIIHNFRSRHKGWTVNVISQPLLFPYYFLFYTDVWSTILVTLAFVIASNQPLGPMWSNYASGLVGFASLWLRQTNIIWIIFFAAVVVAQGSKRSDNLFDMIWNTVSKAFQSWASLLPFIFNIVAFALFIKVNGGITFGDKENHSIDFHVVQVFYCFTFINLFTFPTFASWKLVKYYINFLYDHMVLNVMLALFIKVMIDKFTVVHPFLLADNRHYTFYIYKRLLSHKLSQIATIPIYHFSTWNMIKSFNVARVFPVISIAYFVAVCLVLIPSPLFEPRYYIVPLIIFKLLTRGSTGLRNVFEFVWLSAINAIITYIFLHYEFRWSSEPDVLQRIVW